MSFLARYLQSAISYTLLHYYLPLSTFQQESQNEIKMAVAFPFTNIEELIGAFARHDEFLSRLGRIENETGGFTNIFSGGQPKAVWCVIF
jgi:hypothetical protein